MFCGRGTNALLWRSKCCSLGDPSLSVCCDATLLGDFAENDDADNTNRNRETRAHWVRLASQLDLPIRFVHSLTQSDGKTDKRIQPIPLPLPNRAGKTQQHLSRMLRSLRRISSRSAPRIRILGVCSSVRDTEARRGI